MLTKNAIYSVTETVKYRQTENDEIYIK